MCARVDVRLYSRVFILQSRWLPVRGEEGAALSDRERGEEKRGEERGGVGRGRVQVPSCSLTTDLSPRPRLPLEKQYNVIY